KGIAISQEGIDMAVKNNLDSKLPLLYDGLAQNYYVAGNYKMYGETLKKIITLKDSLYKKIQRKHSRTSRVNMRCKKKKTSSLPNTLILSKKITCFLVLYYCFF